jgi:hypothetical protein
MPSMVMKSTAHTPQLDVSQPIGVPVLPTISLRQWTSKARFNTRQNNCLLNAFDRKNYLQKNMADRSQYLLLPFPGSS